MQDDSTNEPRASLASSEATTSEGELVASPHPPLLPRTSSSSGAPVLSPGIASMLEELAGLTLDALDVAGDAIAERLGLRARRKPAPLMLPRAEE